MQTFRQTSPPVPDAIIDELRQQRSIDTQQMYDILSAFPSQAEQALQIANSVPIRDSREIAVTSNIIIGGMGGSAIGGWVLYNLLQATRGSEQLHLAIHQDYGFPTQYSCCSLAIAISYSGNTEETLSFAHAAQEFARVIVCITSGGKLAEWAQQRAEATLCLLPSGYQPRAAFGYLFFTLLKILMRYQLLPSRVVRKLEREIDETLSHLQQLSALYQSLSAENPAIRLAYQLHNRIPVFYSSRNILHSVSLRWRAQIQENAKQLAFGNVLPEMNHNEINGWLFPEALRQYFVPIFFRDPLDDPRIQKRINVSAQLLSDYTNDPIILEGEGNFFLTRLISLIYFGDWVSYWLALLNQIDPSPVPIIQQLKEQLQSKIQQ